MTLDEEAKISQLKASIKDEGLLIKLRPITLLGELLFKTEISKDDLRQLKIWQYIENYASINEENKDSIIKEYKNLVVQELVKL